MSHPRNPGCALAPDWFTRHGVNRSATERRAASMITRRSLKGVWQAAWLVNAVRCMDLTTLAGDDTPDRVRRLCAKARRPLSDPIMAGLGLDKMPQVAPSPMAFPMSPGAVSMIKARSMFWPEIPEDWGR